jgi:hypothetical protein
MTNQDLIAFVRKNALCVACLAVSVALGVTWYLRSGQLPEAETVLAAKSKQGELIRANIEDAHQLKEQYAAIVDANQTIANRMIHVGQLAENQQFFYRLESETGTKLMGDPRQIAWTAPTKGAAKTTYTPVGFNFVVQGTYKQVIDLLRRLENGDHYCRVISCNLHPYQEQRGSVLQLSLSIELLGIQ